MAVNVNLLDGDDHLELEPHTYLIQQQRHTAHSHSWVIITYILSINKGAFFLVVREHYFVYLIKKASVSTTDNMAKSIKQESSRIEALEKDTESLKENVTKLLSVLTLQADQLSRQEVIINELRDQKRAKENRPLYAALLLLLLLFVVLMFVDLPGYDTVLQLKTFATPLKAPFITTGVKVRFTLGDVVDSVKAAMTKPSTALVVKGRR